MPLKRTVKRAAQKKKEGKAPSTQAGEFVRQEMEEMKSGKGNAKNRKQAIAIGLSEARRSGVDVPPPPGKKKASAKKKAAAKKSAAKKKTAAKKR